MKKALLTAREVHPLIIERLKAMQYTIQQLPEPDVEVLRKEIADCEGLIFTTYTTVNAELMEAGKQLKWVARVGSGMENVDLDAAEKRGIAVFNSPEGNANAVGEHALTLLLNLMNNISKANAEIKEGVWLREENRGEELDGKTVGIIGFGHTGRAFARKLRGFDVEVLAYDKFEKGFGDESVREVGLETILEKADVISLHIPYSEENHHFFGRENFNRTQKPIYLLHTCRGAVLDTKAVLEALQSGKLKGLGIDVFEDEPWKKAVNVEHSIYEQLLHHPRVIATPHIAGWTAESKIKLAAILMNKLEQFLKAEKH